MIAACSPAESFQRVERPSWRSRLFRPTIHDHKYTSSSTVFAERLAPILRHPLALISRPPLLPKATVRTIDPVHWAFTSQLVQAHCRFRTSENLFAENFERVARPSSSSLYRSSALSSGILPFLFPSTMSMSSGFQGPRLGNEGSL